MYLSIIIVTKNDQKGLYKTLFSLSTSFVNYNKIIVQDGSKSKRINALTISHFKKKLSIDYIFTKDKGLYNAMNLAKSRVSKGYVWYLNGGDWIIGNPIKDLNSEMQMPVCTWKSSNGLKISKKKLFNQHFCHQGVLMPYNHDDFNEKYRFAADFDIFMKLKTNFKNLSIKNGFVVSELGGISDINKFKRDLEIIEILLKNKNMKNYLLIIYLKIKNFIRNYIF